MRFHFQFRFRFRLIAAGIAASIAAVFICASVVSAAELISAGAAARSAEYHAEKIYKRDLRIVGRELMTWPWGEPAVYVFTLAGADGGDPAQPSLEPWFLQGARLVSVGREAEGYRLMARPDRYVTVFTGATDDMPALLKAHAGLPEHVLALAVMDNPPGDLAWIYGGLFHVLLASKSRPGPSAGNKAVEIHTKREYSLDDLARDRAKPGALDPRAAAGDWAPFLSPGPAAPIASNPGTPPAGFEITGVEEGEHKLPVAESNINTIWRGCVAAAFYNCVKYLASKGKVKTPNVPADDFMDWIAVCYRTNPFNGWFTAVGRIAPGSSIMFRGMGYASSVGLYERVVNKPELFLAHFATEIKAGYPMDIGGSGKGVFEGHSTTGIGYLKNDAQIQLIIHDGWKTTPNVPVYVKYQGYPAATLEYPRYLWSLRSGAKRAFPAARPEAQFPEWIRCDPTTGLWKIPFKLKSQNDVGVESYAAELTYYDVRGARYLKEGPDRLFPFIEKEELKVKKPSYKAGHIDSTWHLVDGNGHLLKAKSRVKLLEAPVGKFRVTEKWDGYDPGPNTWTVFENGTFKQTRSIFTGARTWTINGTHVKFIEPGKAGYWGPTTYVGTINKAGDRMSGTLSYKSYATGKIVTGPWTATRTANLPN